MKKLVSLLLALLMLCGASALADALPVEDVAPLALPINLPVVPEEIYAHWQLYADETVALPQVSGVAEATGADFVVTISGLDAWCVAPEACTSWRYDTEAEQWVAGEALDIQPQGAAVLSIDAEYYYMNGFPGWQYNTEDQLYSLRVEDYSGDPNNPDYYMMLMTENNTAVIPLAGGDVSLSCYGDSVMSYCVYDEAGVLTTGTYFAENDDGDMVTYAVIPDESEGGEGYVLYYVNVQTAEGDNWLWTEDAWTDIEGNEVAAPEGYSHTDLPFVVIEE